MSLGLKSRKGFFRILARELHVCRIGAQFDVIAPAYGTVISYAHVLKGYVVVPEFENAPTGEVG